VALKILAAINDGFRRFKIGSTKKFHQKAFWYHSRKDGVIVEKKLTEIKSRLEL